MNPKLMMASKGGTTSLSTGHEALGCCQNYRPEMG